MFKGRIDEDVQRKDQERCSEEGLTKVFRRRINKEVLAKMFRRRICRNMNKLKTAICPDAYGKK
eukprot:4443332-Karenia_brevis.AAC.1